MVGLTCRTTSDAPVPLNRPVLSLQPGRLVISELGLCSQDGRSLPTHLGVSSELCPVLSTQKMLNNGL